MGKVVAPSNAKEMTIEAVITRADGTVEKLGVVSYWHKNPLKRWAYKIRSAVGKLVKKD